MMNVIVLNHVMVKVNENDDEYIDVDDHPYYLIPYLLDEDQHQLAKEKKINFMILKVLFVCKHDGAFEKD